MMKKFLSIPLTLSLLLVPLSLAAQEDEAATSLTHTLCFGYYSQQEVLNATPAYLAVKQQQADLKAQYEAEAQRMANEFNNKYEEFIEVQRTLAPAILNKRQAELQEMAERGEAFKQDALQHLQQSEQEALAPVMQRLHDTLKQIGDTQAYAFIVNTDNLSMPYINPEQGEDITALLISRMKDER